MTEAVFTPKELSEIKKYRAIACWIVAARLIMMGVIGWLNFAKISVPNVLPSVFVVLSIMLAIFLLISVYLLAQNLKLRAWLFTLGLIVPVVSLIIFIYLVVKATKILRAHAAD